MLAEAAEAHGGCLRAYGLHGRNHGELGFRRVRPGVPLLAVGSGRRSRVLLLKRTVSIGVQCLMEFLRVVRRVATPRYGSPWVRFCCRRCRRRLSRSLHYVDYLPNTLDPYGGLRLALVFQVRRSTELRLRNGGDQQLDDKEIGAAVAFVRTILPLLQDAPENTAWPKVLRTRMRKFET